MWAAQGGLTFPGIYEGALGLDVLGNLQIILLQKMNLSRFPYCAQRCPVLKCAEVTMEGGREGERELVHHVKRNFISYWHFILSLCPFS